MLYVSFEQNLRNESLTFGSFEQRVFFMRVFCIFRPFFNGVVSKFLLCISEKLSVSGDHYNSVSLWWISFWVVSLLIHLFVLHLILVLA